MPELRKDPVIGRWVIIANERARRPGNIVDRQRTAFNLPQDVAFSENHGKEIYTVKSADGDTHPWRVRVVPCGTPLLSPDAKKDSRGHGLYDVCEGYGLHEIVLDTPDPIANMADLEEDQIRMVFETYVSRITEIEKDPRIEYAIVYKNYGDISHNDMGHSYSQILASPVIPLHIMEKLTGARRYFEYHERCIYTDIVRQECADRSRIVAETDHFVAILPFAARLLFELWILPKEQHCDFHHGVIGKEADLARIMKDVLTRVKVGLDDPAYTFVINSSPFRRPSKDGSKWDTIEEDYCWHLEITPRLTRVAGFEKGTGFYICSIPPEDTAEFLRTVEI